MLGTDRRMERTTIIAIENVAIFQTSGVCWKVGESACHKKIENVSTSHQGSDWYGNGPSRGGVHSFMSLGLSLARLLTNT